MKPTILVTILFLFVYGLAAQTRQAAPVSSQTEKAVIAGTVVRAGSGEPVRRALVSLLSVGQQGQARNQKTVSTGDDGAFIFADLNTGQYRVSVDRDGYIRQEFGQRTWSGQGTIITAAAGQRLAVNFQLVVAGTIAGRILNEDGDPLAGIQVQALAYIYRDGVRTMMPSRGVQTNDLGEYRLYWLTPGEYYVSAVPNARLRRVVETAATRPDEENYAPSYFPGVIEPESAAPVRLDAAAEIRGIDFVLRPVPTMRVRGRIISPDASPAAVAPQPAVPGLPGQPGGQRGGQRGGGGQRAQVVLARSNGASVQGVRLEGGSQLRTNVNPDGTFEIANVIPGSYTLTAIQMGDRPVNLPRGSSTTTGPIRPQVLSARTHVEVGSADVDNITLALRPGIQISGQIYVDGQTTPPEFQMNRLRITLAAVGDVPQGIMNGNQVSVNANGTFALPNVADMTYRVRIDGLPAGAYLLAGRYGSADALGELLQISTDQSLPLYLQIGFSPGRVDGTVTDQRDQPFAGATCVLIPGARNRMDLYKTALTDQYGRCSFSNVAPGDYKVIAWEDIPQGAHLDPGFVNPAEDRAKPARVEKSGTLSVQVKVIPANP